MEQQQMSDKMDEFLDKVDKICYEYGYEIHPTVYGWTGKRTETIAIIGEDEFYQVHYIDGDGRGK